MVAVHVATVGAQSSWKVGGSRTATATARAERWRVAASEGWDGRRGSGLRQILQSGSQWSCQPARISVCNSEPEALRRRFQD